MSKSTIRSLVHEIKEVAEHASLVGHFRGGLPVMVDVYNKCLTTLQEQGDDVVGSLFPPLSADKDSIDIIGASSALLYAYLTPECENNKYKTFVRDVGPGKEVDE